MKLELLNKIQLDEFISAQPHSQFLQSWDWGEFQRAVGHGVWRLGVFDQTLDHRLIASAQIIQHQLPLKKSYLYCPRGPVFAEGLTDEQKTTALELILSKARDITILTSQTEEIFFRLEPTISPQSSILNLKQTKPIQPANTLILDLTQPEAQLLNNMHPKTRYNIKVAKRHSLIIQEEKNFNKVWLLFVRTSRRDKFNIYPKNYYQKILEIVPWIKLWVAKHQEKIISAVIISCFGDTATYLHGASDYTNRQLMAPHLLHWSIILEAKNQSYQYYDFHGISPSNNPQHPWAGMTRFKLGFGGQVVNYPGTFDFVYQNNSYQLYKILRVLNYWLKRALTIFAN